MTDISVVVGTYNRLAFIKKCVESAIRETNRPFRLYVTDAGSTDGTVEYLKSVASDQIVPILVGKKLGQARAYNDVFRTVTTPYVCWISDDNEIVNGGLDLAAEILDRDRRIGMVALKVKDVQGPFVDAPYIGGVSSLGILNVNQGMLRTEVLAEVGYFSEAFRDYGIDPDLTAKVLLAGHDIVYTRPVAIYHYRLWETDKSKPEYWALRKKQERSRALYKAKYAKVMPLSPIWLAKNVVWRLIRDLLGARLNLNGVKPFLGHIPRDWGNYMTGRYISLFEAFQRKNKVYHLRQRAPRLFRPRTLPADPIPDAHSEEVRDPQTDLDASKAVRP